MHRDQHSSIQMDGLEDDTIAAGDTHQFDQSLSSSGCRPRGRSASAPRGQSCAVRQRSRPWQRCGAARHSRPSDWEPRRLFRRDSIGMIGTDSYIDRVQPSRRFTVLALSRVAHGHVGTRALETRER